MSNINDFCNVYSVTRTLRFELKPVGKTLHNVVQSGILEEDRKRAEHYIKLKRMIDVYHKYFINGALQHISPDLHAQILHELVQYHKYVIISKKSEEETQALEGTRTELRKLIVSLLTGKLGNKTVDEERYHAYDQLFKENMVRELLPNVWKQPTSNIGGIVVGREEFAQQYGESSIEDNLNLLGEFYSFNSYLTGFYTNRQNIYSAEDKATSIGHRLIHENLPKFVDNMQAYERAKSVLGKEIAQVYKRLSKEGYLNGATLDEVFSLEYFIQTFTQGGIELYNAVIGKIVTSDGRELKGINEQINLYNQQKSAQERLPLLKPLYKQILSDREQLSWLPETFESDQELLDTIQSFYTQIEAEILSRTQTLMETIGDYDLSKIFVRNDNQLTDISKRLLEHWEYIDKARRLSYDQAHAPSKQTEKYEKTRDKVLNNAKVISLEELNASISLLELPESRLIESYFRQLGRREDSSDLIAKIKAAYDELKPLLAQPYPEEQNLIQDKAQVSLIKNLLDNISALQRFIKPLQCSIEEGQLDEQFYGEYNHIWEALSQIIPLYNKVRDYLTRKPYSTEKIKLNFRNSTLLNGWDRNKETDNYSIILRKGELYYLAIMDSKHNKLFEAKKLPSDGPCYEKMDYKLIPGPNKMLPKVFFSKKNIDTYKPSSYILDNYKQGRHKKGEDFSPSFMYALIDFFKDSIAKHPDWKHFRHQFSPTESYETIADFYREVADQGYTISFREVSEAYIDQLVEEGKLYLFQIYNKDFSPYSRGTANLHTLYWRMLFDPRSLKNSIYKLNGEAEVFFRKKSITSERPTHPAHEPISKKKPENKGQESLFAYDLIKNKRYTVDKFQFHVPITMNFTSGNQSKLNEDVQQMLREQRGCHIIGIDRGERHLLYLSVINEQGEILEQRSLNIVESDYAGNTYKTDYQALLTDRAATRKQERQNWQTIEGIRDLKQGYLSQAVHQITQLMVKYGAIIALEDLNMGFKRSRQRIESSLYQQFEKQLIDKLTYLVDKKKDVDLPGGLLHAYQLVEPFEGFSKMTKQNGFIFYIPAWNTSKIDPTTGFVNLFHVAYESVPKAQDFFSRFRSIHYNKDRRWFEFEFDYEDFPVKIVGPRTKWTACTYGTRILTERKRDKNNEWSSEEIDITQKLCELFDSNGIKYQGVDNLKETIIAKGDKSFLSELMHLYKLTLQMRNSQTGTDIDYLISPVLNQEGDCFDTRVAKASLPTNADANGAYNIALKALWTIRQIRAHHTKLFRGMITNKEWLAFVQEKHYLND